MMSCVLARHSLLFGIHRVLASPNLHQQLGLEEDADEAGVASAFISVSLPDSPIESCVCWPVGWVRSTFPPCGALLLAVILLLELKLSYADPYRWMLFNRPARNSIHCATHTGTLGKLCRVSLQPAWFWALATTTRCDQSTTPPLTTAVTILSQPATSFQFATVWALCVGQAAHIRQIARLCHVRCQHCREATIADLAFNSDADGRVRVRMRVYPHCPLPTCSPAIINEERPKAAEAPRHQD
jgi:hypothetical protein